MFSIAIYNNINRNKIRYVLFTNVEKTGHLDNLIISVVLG